MPSFNQSKFIEESIRSVLGQSYPSIELVVLDGGSTDDTIPILKSLGAEFSGRLRWDSEPDRGPAHAINKGLERVRGTIIGWLNSDDIYRPGAVQRAVEALEAQRDWLMVYGRADHINEAGLTIDAYPTLPPSVLVESFQFGCFICQPTVFFRRSLYVLLGGLDESLKTAFDFELWLRVFRYVPERVGFMQQFQARSRIHAATITANSSRTVAIEAIKILHKHTGAAPTHWILTHLSNYMKRTGPISALDLEAEFKSIIPEINNWVSPKELGGLEFEVTSNLLPLCRSGNAGGGAGD